MTTASADTNLLQQIRDLVAPVASIGGTSVPLTTAAARLPDVACRRGFALQVASGGTAVYVGGATVTSAGANAVAIIEPGGDPVWFGGTSPALLYAVASQGTPTLYVHTE